MTGKLAWTHEVAATLDDLAGTLVVAVSGGLDSMVLLQLCTDRLAADRLVVAHFNHRQRGDASDADARFVEEACRERGVAVRVGGWEHPGPASEEVMREARRAFLGEVVHASGASAVLLAHHADDQAETVLWNLARGAGLRGAAGMATSARQFLGSRQVAVARPLLAVRKDDLREFADSRGLAWREDATNRDEAATRNRIRHTVLPALAEAAGRDPVTALARFAELARADDDRLASEAAEALDACRGPDGSLAVAPWRDLDLALRRRVVGLWLAQVGVAGTGLREVDAVVEVAAGAGRPARANLPGGRQVRRRAGFLRLAAQSEGHGQAANPA